MASPTIGLRLRDRLGPEASQELSQTFEEAENDMLTTTSDRFEGRLIAVGSDIRQDMARMDAGFRIALTERLADVGTEISEMRAEVLRWSFLFWVGQVAATAAVLGFMLRLIGR